MWNSSRMLEAVNLALQALSARRPIFHSEADFQHEFSHCLRQSLQVSQVRLEVPLVVRNEVFHVDIIIGDETEKCAIELKYIKAHLACTVAGETFKLKSQAATDLARYDFLKDVQRLETLCAANEGPAAKISHGFAVLLTNESGLWREPIRKNSADAEFRIHEGALLAGRRRWGDAAGLGTQTGRPSLHLSGSYIARWQDYSSAIEIPHGTFRYLLWPTDAASPPTKEAFT